MSLESRHAPVVSVQFWIRAGSIMEVSQGVPINSAGFKPGLAHFLEHMTFKGSGNRAAGELSAQIESWGGEINAYTTFDRTVYYLTVANAFIFDALDLLSDAVFNSSLASEEIEREREVILEEVARSLDDPGVLAAAKIFARAYGNSEAGRPVIGSKESVAAISRADLVSFRDRFYRPENSAVVIVGDFDRPAVMEWLEKNIKPHEQKNQVSPVWGKTEFHASIPLRREPLSVELIRGDYQQVRFDLAITIPDQDHVDIPALDLCAYLLGGGDLGLLNRDLRDDQGLVSSAAATLFSPAFPGLFEISFVTSESLAMPAVEAVANLIGAFATSDDWGEQDLARAKSAIRAEKVFREETIEGLARFGHGICSGGKHKYESESMHRLEGLTVSDLRSAWLRWIKPENFHIVAVLPRSATFDEKQIQSHFLAGAGLRKNSDSTEEKQFATSTTRKELHQTTVIRISEGLRFVYKQRPGAGVFSLVLATEGGQRAEIGDVRPQGIFNALASNLARATAEVDPHQFSWLVESSGADLAAFSGKDSLGFRISCLNQDLESLLPLLWQSLLAPEFPEPQFETFKREVDDYFRHVADSPATLCMRRLQKAVLGQHPYGGDIVGEPETVAALTRDDLASAFASWTSDGPWVMAGCGAMSFAEAEAMVKSGLTAFQPSGVCRRFESDSIEYPGGGRRIVVPMDRQQAHLAIGVKGPGWRADDRYAVDVLCNILGGTGGRLFRNLRDRDGLAYSVAPILSYGNNRGLIGAYIACGRDKVERAEAGIWEEFQRIANEGPTGAELERARQYICGSHVMELQSSESQASTMALMELYGIGYDAYEKYPAMIRKIDVDDVVTVAKKYLVMNSAQTVIVGS